MHHPLGMDDDVEYSLPYSFTPFYSNNFFAIPSQVNYVTETLSVPGYLSEKSPQVSILCQMLSLGPLHQLIREKGGAYGAGARISPLSGTITFTTYRDPNTWASLENFRNAVESVSQGNVR